MQEWLCQPHTRAGSNWERRWRLHVLQRSSSAAWRGRSPSSSMQIGMADSLLRRYQAAPWPQQWLRLPCQMAHPHQPRAPKPELGLRLWLSSMLQLCCCWQGMIGRATINAPMGRH